MYNVEMSIKDVNEEDISKIFSSLKNKGLNLEININLSVEKLINMVEYYISRKIEHIGDISVYDEYSPNIIYIDDEPYIVLFNSIPDEYVIKELYNEIGVNFEKPVKIEKLMTMMFMDFSEHCYIKDTESIKLSIPIENLKYSVFYKYIKDNMF